MSGVAKQGALLGAGVVAGAILVWALTNTPQPPATPAPPPASTAAAPTPAPTVLPAATPAATPTEVEALAERMRAMEARIQEQNEKLLEAKAAALAAQAKGEDPALAADEVLAKADIGAPGPNESGIIGREHDGFVFDDGVQIIFDDDDSDYIGPPPGVGDERGPDPEPHEVGLEPGECPTCAPD